MKTKKLKKSEKQKNAMVEALMEIDQCRVTRSKKLEIGYDG